MQSLFINDNSTEAFKSFWRMDGIRKEYNYGQTGNREEVFNVTKKNIKSVEIKDMTKTKA